MRDMEGEAPKNPCLLRHILAARQGPLPALFLATACDLPAASGLVGLEL